jgi:hypothetical protein
MPCLKKLDLVVEVRVSGDCHGNAHWMLEAIRMRSSRSSPAKMRLSEKSCVRAEWLTHNSPLLCLDLHLEALEGHALRMLVVALSALRRDLHDSCCVE